MPCLLSDNGLHVCAMCEQVDRYKVLQIGYDPEHDRLTWDGWEIHCGQSLEVLLPDRLGGGTWRHVSFECNDAVWYMPDQREVSPVGLWAREAIADGTEAGALHGTGFFSFTIL